MAAADGSGPGAVRQRTRRRQQHPATIDRARPGSISVHRVNYQSGTPVSESAEDGELIDVPVFQTEPAYVDVVGSITRNMGNYNSVRIEVKLSMPALPVITEVDRVYHMASGWVEDKLEEEMSRASDTRAPTESERRR